MFGLPSNHLVGQLFGQAKNSQKPLVFGTTEMQSISYGLTKIRAA